MVFNEVEVPTTLQRNKGEGNVDQGNAIPTEAVAMDEDHRQ